MDRPRFSQSLYLVLFTAVSTLILGAAPNSANAQPAPAAAPPGGQPNAAQPVASPNDSAATKPTPAEAKAKYSLPWLLRPAIAPTLLRLDSAFDFADKATIVAPVLTGGYAFIPKTLGVYARVGMVSNAPKQGESATALSNPLFFVLFTPEVAPGVRVGGFLGVTAPIGAGGGNNPDLNNNNAMKAGIYSRQAMDNALFATNYFTPTVGVTGAYIQNGLTVQADVTLLELIRVKGDLADKDENRTNFTTGLHLGYQVIPLITPSLEFHYQHWLSTPAAVSAPPPKGDPSRRGQATLGAGVRFNLPIGKDAIMRPGIAYFHPLEDPMTAAKDKIIQFDLPVAF